MNARATVAALGLVMLAGLAGCARSCARSEPSPSPTPAPPAAGTSGGVADAAKKLLMDSVVLGHSLAPDGSVSAPGVTFGQGQPLFVSLQVSAISPGTEVKLSWYGPSGASEGDDQLVVPPGASVVNFRAKDTSAWPPGPHRVEVWVGGAKAGEKAFTITPSRSPSA